MHKQESRRPSIPGREPTSPTKAHLKKAQDPNRRMSTRPTPAPWADTPYRLIPSPRKDMPATGAVFVASEMANVHNVILRGLNSIVQQAPYIADALQPEYDAEDVSDLLTFVSVWCEVLKYHHDVEESIFYPQVEELTGIPELMDELEEQHEEFEDGVSALKIYVDRVVEQPEHYRWATMRTIIEGFAPALVYHLHDEIDFLLSMDKFHCEGLERCWLQTEKVSTISKDSNMMFRLLPFMIGNSDKSIESHFPPLPKTLKHAIKLWYANKYKGAWRFNCCDFSGRPVPLQMLPENQMED